MKKYVDANLDAPDNAIISGNEPSSEIYLQRIDTAIFLV